MIPVAQLAALLDSSPAWINKLIRLGYLKGGKGRMVELPARGAVQWLKQMLRPLPSRPLFTVPEVLSISGLSLKLFRKIILAWDIPLHYDPAFGELISPNSLIALINALHGLREPVRFDRVVLLNWMQGMGSNKYVKPKLAYSRLIDLEIRRIAELPEPERTTNARAFYNAYKDARLVSHALNWKYGDNVSGKNRVAGNYERETTMRKLEGQIREVLDDSTKPTALAAARKVARKARKRKARWEKGIIYKKERNFKAFAQPLPPVPQPSHPSPVPPAPDPPPLPDSEQNEEPR